MKNDNFDRQEELDPKDYIKHNINLNDHCMIINKCCLIKPQYHINGIIYIKKKCF